MRILTTISYYRPYVSGLTICAQRLIEGLSKKGFEFTVLTSRHDRSLPKRERQEKISILRQAAIFTVGKVPVMPGYLPVLIRQMWKIDLVWIHLPQAEGLLTALIAKFFHKPIIVTLHCLPLVPSGWQRLLFQRIFDFLSNAVIKLADQVVYHTQDYVENTPELLHIPQKSKYIFPPVPMPKVKVIKIKNRNNVIRIGFAARLAEDKGFEYLIQALEILNKQKIKTQLFVVGPPEPIGEKKYVNKIHNLLDKTKLNIKFLGVIPSMDGFYRLIDILVLPSVNRTEAFGLVQVEAMLNGIPVIASNLPGVRVPIKLTAAGKLVPPNSPAALAEAVTGIYRHPPDKNQISRPARLIFSSRNTLTQYANQFLTLHSFPPQ